MSHLYILISSISSVQTHKLILVVTAYLWLQTHSGGVRIFLGTDSSWWCQNISVYRLILVVTEYFWVQTHSGGVRIFLGTDSFWWCQNTYCYRLPLSAPFCNLNSLAGTIQIRRVRIWRLFAHICSRQNVLSSKLL